MHTQAQELTCKSDAHSNMCHPLGGGTNRLVGYKRFCAMPATGSLAKVVCDIALRNAGSHIQGLSHEHHGTFLSRLRRRCCPSSSANAVSPSWRSSHLLRSSLWSDVVADDLALNTRGEHLQALWGRSLSSVRHSPYVFHLFRWRCVPRNRSLNWRNIG